MSTKPLLPEDNLAELTVSRRDILNAGPCKPFMEDYVRPALPNLVRIMQDDNAE